MTYDEYIKLFEPGNEVQHRETGQIGKVWREWIPGFIFVRVNEKINTVGEIDIPEVDLILGKTSDFIPWPPRAIEL